MLETCEHGAFWSDETHRTNRGCCERPFPPDPGPELTPAALRVYREVAHTLTEGYHTRHAPGGLVIGQEPNWTNGTDLIRNAVTRRVLWEARWGNGPASEALCLAPWGMRELLREVDRLRARVEDLEEDLRRAREYSPHHEPFPAGCCT
jgi:hypothetical protein